MANLGEDVKSSRKKDDTSSLGLGSSKSISHGIAGNIPVWVCSWLAQEFDSNQES